MLKSRVITTEPEFNGNTILTDQKKGLAADVDILRRIQNQFDYAEDSKSKVFFFRFDIHFPANMLVPEDNEHFKRFISAYMKNLSRQGLMPQYCAVREQRFGMPQHYHVAMFLDGQKTKSCFYHLQTASRLWANELGILTANPEGLGLINYCEKDFYGNRMINGMMIDPTKPNYEYFYETCFRRASYLAKVNQKELTPSGYREYFASQIPMHNG